MKLVNSRNAMVVMVGCLLLGLSGAVNPALPAVRAQEPGDPVNIVAKDVVQPGPAAGGMPGWPAPQRTIPYHEPGRPSRSAAYTTQVTQFDEAGVQNTVQLTGLDAMTADGIDPLAGNYRVAESAQIMAGGRTYAWESASPSPEEIGAALPPPSQLEADLAAGDVNGDGIDEQIVAWLDNNGHLKLQVGSMPGQNRFTSGPAAVSHTDGSVDVLARGLDGALYRGFLGNGWQWENGAGLLISGPAIASRGDGTFDAFAVGMDNLIYRRHWDGSAWSGDWELVDDASSWAQARGMPGPTNTMPADMDAPAAVARGIAQIDLFRRMPDSSLGWRHSDDGSAWGSWQNLGGVITSTPSAVSRDAGHLQIFARGVDGAIWYCTLAGGDCREWGYLEMPAGISAASAPTAVSPPGSGEVYLYVYGSDGALWANRYSGNNWQGWQEEVLPFAPAPAKAVGAAYREGQIDLFVLAEDGTLQQRTAGSWRDRGRPDCCAELYTGDTAYVREYETRVTTGHFMGAGRELIAVTAVGPGGDGGTWTVTLFDVKDGLEPYVLSTTTQDGYFPGPLPGKFDIAVGDVAGLGVDQILLAHLWRWPGGGSGWSVYRTQCHRESVARVVTTNCEELDIPVLVRGLTTNWEIEDGGHIHIAAGDIDGDDAYDEWALVVGALDWDHHESYRYIYDTEDDLEEEWYHNVRDEWNTPADVTIGNVMEEREDPPPDPPEWEWPQKDEIVFASGYWPDSKTRLDVYRWDQNLNPKAQHWYSYLYAEDPVRMGLETADLNADLVEEIVVTYDVDSSRYLRVHAYDWKTDWVEPGPAIPIAYWGPCVPAAGDFRGDSLRLGPPTYRVQEQMTTPVMFLNLPPMHSDIIDGNRIEVVSGAFARFVTVNSQQEESTSLSSREWSLSTGLETSAGVAGNTVKTSFDNTYGEKFSHAGTTIRGRTLTQEIVADIQDQVIYNATTYGVWEYPVLGVPEGQQTGPTTVSVVYPLLSPPGDPLTELPRNKGYPSSCDENFYAPTHQTKNVWSYDPVGDIRFPDYDEEIGYLVHEVSTGGSTLTLFIEEEETKTRTASYHNQVSAGLEYSYENELKIPLIGKAWDFSFRAYVNGSYGWANFSTFKTELAKNTAVTLSLPSIGTAYTIWAYLYQAKPGYWVLDYQTAPEGTSGVWRHYDKPDPAFTLNWYGDPLTTTVGLQYPCGQEKQLFTHDLVIEPQYAQIGESVTISATVRNFSPVPPSGPVTVRFYLGDPSENQQIGEDKYIYDLDRETGPQTVETTWTASGAGKQKIFAVIDPGDTIPEVHEAGDLIDNNTAYGLVYVAGADYVDPGLQQEVPYQEVLAELRPLLEVTAFLPTADFTTTLRYELVPMPPGSVSVSGGLFRLDVYEGGQADPPPSHVFAPAPTVVGIHAPDQDINSLKLFTHTGTEWVEVTCPGFETIRFPSADRMYVPVCELKWSRGSLKGTFALSTTEPHFSAYLPVALKRAP